jgi:hypothetical protein
MEPSLTRRVVEFVAPLGENNLIACTRLRVISALAEKIN